MPRGRGVAQPQCMPQVATQFLQQCRIWRAAAMRHVPTRCRHAAMLRAAMPVLPCTSPQATGFFPDPCASWASLVSGFPLALPTWPALPGPGTSPQASLGFFPWAFLRRRQCHQHSTAGLSGPNPAPRLVGPSRPNLSSPAPNRRPPGPNHSPSTAGPSRPNPAPHGRAVSIAAQLQHQRYCVQLNAHRFFNWLARPRDSQHSQCTACRIRRHAATSRCRQRDVARPCCLLLPTARTRARIMLPCWSAAMLHLCSRRHVGGTAPRRFGAPSGTRGASPGLLRGSSVPLRRALRKQMLRYGMAQFPIIIIHSLPRCRVGHICLLLYQQQLDDVVDATLRAVALLPCRKAARPRCREAAKPRCCSIIWHVASSAYYGRHGRHDQRQRRVTANEAGRIRPPAVVGSTSCEGRLLWDQVPCVCHATSSAN